MKKLFVGFIAGFSIMLIIRFFPNKQAILNKCRHTKKLQKESHSKSHTSKADSGVSKV